MYYEHPEKKYYRFPSSSNLIDLDTYDMNETVYFPGQLTAPVDLEQDHDIRHGDHEEQKFR